MITPPKQIASISSGKDIKSFSDKTTPTNKFEECLGNNPADCITQIINKHYVKDDS